jgi:hypothetical protein
MQFWVFLFIAHACVALQERLIATGTGKPSPTKTTTTKGVEKCLGDRCEPEEDVAIPPDNKACKDCCPRPKATVTVTSTAYTTEVCTHTISRDRTQFTTVRFTNTFSTITTRTKSINFINTTTIIGSRQVTTFHTVLAIKYNYFTIFTTIFTSWQLATAVFTTRIPTTRTTSIQIRVTITGVDVSAITLQVLTTVPSTVQTFVGGTSIIASNQILTITSTEIAPIFDYGMTVWQDSPYSIVSIDSETYSSLDTSFLLDNTVGVWYSYNTVTQFPTVIPLTNTVSITTYTGTVVWAHTSLGTLTFSKLYPPGPIPPGYAWP